MKLLITTAFTLICFFAKSQFTVQVNAPQYKGGIAYLTYYYGKSMNIEDSAAANENGKMVFKKDTKLTPGVYSIVFPGKTKSFDFLAGDDVTEIKIDVPDTTDLVFKSKVTGSKENELFNEYQQYVATKGPLMEHERTAYKNSKTAVDSALHEKKFKEIENDITGYREAIINGKSTSMLAALLKSMKEPPVLIAAPKTKEDSLENYHYYKKHYWDGVSFDDPRIIRSPFFIPKVERYFRQVIPPVPDSIIKEADYLLLLSRSTPQMYRFLLNWLTDEYYYPKYMGQDAVFVHLFEKYHSKGISDWLNEKQIKAISDRAYMVMSNLIGKPAAPLMMSDSNGVEKALYNIKSNFTVIVFWDPSCGHCQHELPRLDSIYKAKWQKEGVTMYAVLTDNSHYSNWKKFINEHNLGAWTHVYETDAEKKAVEDARQPSYRQLYDVIQTPTIYLLDKDKRIIAKKLTMEQLDDLIDTKLKQPSK